jgi:hypothetical protein
MPGARCARSRMCSVESTRVSHHGHTGATRHSLRNGFTAYFVLSPVTGLFCHRRLADNSAKLDASVGASGPHGFAVRVSALVSSAARVHRIPHPTFVTCATPLFRDGTAGHVHLIWVRREQKYFCEGGWTGFSDLPARANRYGGSFRFSVIPRECGVSSTLRPLD